MKYPYKHLGYLERCENCGEYLVDLNGEVACAACMETEKARAAEKADEVEQ